MTISSSCKFSLCFLLYAALSPLSAQNSKLQLWYWHHSLLNSPQNLASSEALMDRAVAAGYTGVAFWDVSSEFINSPIWPPGAANYYQEAMAYARRRGLQVTVPGMPYGFSNDVLENNPNWAESQRVVGTQYQVDSARSSLQVINSFPGLLNSGFESGMVDWFDIGDAGVTVDTTTAHTGHNSVLIHEARGNGRIRQELTLQPWRQYHLRFFVKTQAYGAETLASILDDSNFDIEPLNTVVQVYEDQDWTQMDYTFNSQNTTKAWLYMGVWGGSAGSIWFDDITVEETGLIYLTRRDGTPLRIYDPNNPNTTFQEGVDYNSVADPVMSTLMPFSGSWHTPPTITLPASSRLRPGQIVAVDSYSADPIPLAWGQNMCFTDAGVQQYVQANAAALSNVIPPQTSILLGYDEIRQMNSCASCKAKGMTAGQLLAWSVGQSIQTYRSVLHNPPLWVWSDMFDPYHNATAHYYHVEGDLAGSWSGLQSDVIILNWNLGNLTASLNWFAGNNPQQTVPHSQIIAGYYDNGDGYGSAQQELAAASGIRGLLGLMYTSWSDDYSQLESFAAAAYANWPAYVASLPNNGHSHAVGAGIIGVPKSVSSVSPVNASASSDAAWAAVAKLAKASPARCPVTKR